MRLIVLTVAVVAGLGIQQAAGVPFVDIHKWTQSGERLTKV